MIKVNEEELRELLQNTGDAIADTFEQYIKGNWKDDHGHDVGMNKAFISLKTSMVDLMEYRWKVLNYSEPGADE